MAGRGHAGLCKIMLVKAIEADEVDSVGSILQNIVMDAAARVGMVQTVRVGREDPRVVTPTHRP